MGRSTKQESNGARTRAANGAKRILCALKPPMPLNLPPSLAPDRLSAIVLTKNKWVNGTELSYYLVDRRAALKAQHAVVRKAFAHWKARGIGLKFVETDAVEEAELRIAFAKGGSWSYVGTDNLDIEMPNPTMNFGWDLTTPWGWATALHEIGHAMGLPHEHQNPKSGIVWDETAVYAAFRASQGWDDAQILDNILRKIPAADVSGTAWDPLSIMHYPFGAGLIKAPKPYDQGTPENTALSAKDIAFIKELYPPLAGQPQRLAPMELAPLALRAGGQADFVIEPQATRYYAIQTVGRSDSKLVLFEERDGRPRYLTADDDSGAEKNASLRVRLVRGRRYVLRVRLHYLSGAEGFGVTMI